MEEAEPAPECDSGYERQRHTPMQYRPRLQQNEQDHLVTAMVCPFCRSWMDSSQRRQCKVGRHVVAWPGTAADHIEAPVIGVFGDLLLSRGQETGQLGEEEVGGSVRFGRRAHDVPPTDRSTA